MRPFSWLGLSLVAVALAQILFKLYVKDRRGALLIVAIAFFLMTPLTTYKALQGLPLSTVYVATAASQLLVVLISLLFMGERYARKQYAGFLLVLVGMLVFNL